MVKPISSRSQEPAVSALEEGVHRLEVRTEALTGAVRVLTRGLAAGPLAEPAWGRAAEAARRAHELLLAAESAPPGDLTAGEARQAASRRRSCRY
jgi:exonuclease VII small subunit